MVIQMGKIIHKEQYHGQILEIELPEQKKDQRPKDYRQLCRSIISKFILDITTQNAHSGLSLPSSQQDAEAIALLTHGRRVSSTTKVSDLLMGLSKRSGNQHWNGH